ncbi:Retrovirus-related Pol polyprotein from type-1 retrotransposable element [Trichinella papuae]|uniref:Retrovirus-related Pol polyprotein from type-1 retrotransposable element n=1 Tax=Trichinella papuae TaxID=268474 RepID=A0A0V1M7P6_9BILA|nr:Retrovirus-related Pol polyprotein from type-1 retrotransposable element [Trichinella papuae]
MYSVACHFSSCKKNGASSLTSLNTSGTPTSNPITDTPTISRDNTISHEAQVYSGIITRSLSKVTTLKTESRADLNFINNQARNPPDSVVLTHNEVSSEMDNSSTARLTIYQPENENEQLPPAQSATTSNQPDTFPCRDSLQPPVKVPRWSALESDTLRELEDALRHNGELSNEKLASLMTDRFERVFTIDMVKGHRRKKRTAALVSPGNNKNYVTRITKHLIGALRPEKEHRPKTGRKKMNKPEPSFPLNSKQRKRMAYRKVQQAYYKDPKRVVAHLFYNQPLENVSCPVESGEKALQARLGMSSGLQLHCKRAHPDAFLQTCVQKTKARWSVDEINLLAKVEAKLHPACKNINQVLEQKLTDFHIARNVEMMKGQRRKAAYKELVLQYRRCQQQEKTVGSPCGVVGSSPQVISTSAHDTDALSNDLIREAYSLPEVDIDDLQTKLLHNLAPSSGPSTRGVRKYDSRPQTETTKTNVRVARFKRFQRLFQNNRGKLASHILDGASLDQFNGNIDEATALLVKTLSSRPILPANDEAESSNSPCVSVTQPITAEEVSRELKAARPTAVGPDGLKLHRLRELNAFDIASLFNLWLKAGKLPVSVKASRTIFIPKIDGTSDISKCRPITIASMLYRLFSRIITKGLAAAVHLSERQKAFLPGVNGVFDNASSLYAFIKDAKARALLRKKVHPALFDLISNVLTGTTYAEVKGLKGNAGRRISVLAFADDMTLLADSAAGLKILLKVSSDFLAESGMMLNAERSESFRETR